MCLAKSKKPIPVVILTHGSLLLVVVRGQSITNDQSPSVQSPAGQTALVGCVRLVRTGVQRQDNPLEAADRGACASDISSDIALAKSENGGKRTKESEKAGGL
jgi:hypothetical protein